MKPNSIYTYYITTLLFCIISAFQPLAFAYAQHVVYTEDDLLNAQNNYQAASDKLSSLKEQHIKAQTKLKEMQNQLTKVQSEYQQARQNLQSIESNLETAKKSFSNSTSYLNNVWNSLNPPNPPGD